MKDDSLSIRETCTWKWDRSETYVFLGFYQTECQEEYLFNDEPLEVTPLENSLFKFCPYCGKRIVEEGIKV